MGITGPRGTNDILPEESLKWQYVEETAQDIFKRYNYQEIRTPIFEDTNLFQRGIGETTDIVEKEMYTFDDKGGRSITLRPEGTASVVRSFLEHKVYGQAQPTKYYYFGPMFRYERPQSGRYRQFHQLGVEVLGADNPAIDAEVIALGLQILTELGLSDLEVHLNSVGCPDCRDEYREALMDYFAPNLDDLCSDCQSRYERNPLRILDCKNENCKEYTDDAPEIYDSLCDECADHFDMVEKYLEELEIDYILDPRLVRGLDYYTKTAFEIIYTGLGAQDTIFGGGRYDGLAEEVGGREIPGIGFAMGMERIILALEEQEVDLPLTTDLDLFITTIGQPAQEAAFKYLYQLRKAGLRVEMDHLDRSVKGQMKCADRNNAQYSIILGGNELEKGVATIREMKTGEQEEIELDNLITVMKEKVE
ncbi:MULTISPECIES: histidine--tRNA ligase [unclassified Candidatus Frackibacter]|uniref:histidine--tRNA ligase n=1 Tax=unclassified Candidatus Frackibacter TaxID=2648818 RepID=UPI000885AE80|nr:MULTISPECIES: histidine--tRNA ligase [unclassified Candidatus Frackibacter]SDC64610.1 histidyl-tRNA synthetase [Candidatus Frackibacter sp. WG11]SEM77351.1 histidyl-tRNA synthetase [Candidatus Frackibacter sp. WG12]SFL88714.1 histidyl-tRNA synthetase [Candidatus Frackibacter sp. WG13]